jgi:hypothetical protein
MSNYFSSPTTFLKVDEVVYFSSMKRPFLSVKRLVMRNSAAL